VDVSDTLVLAVILLARLLIPLLIFRYPLPAIVACLVIDAADQTILMRLTDIDVESPDSMYQVADKALDIYYLTMAYCSVLRNWTNGTAVEVARFLWYYRLVGVALFETTDQRWLLLVFPNTFEYYFIAIEAIRTMWDPRRLTKKMVFGITAFIWIVIKLPQEWWIHVAQLDFTEFMAANPWAWGVIAIAALAVGVVGWKLYRRAPQPDWSFRVDRDKPCPVVPGLDLYDPPLRWPLQEKIILLTLVVVIFANVLRIDARFWQEAAGAVVVVLLTLVVSHWLARHEPGLRGTVREFLILGVVNAAGLGMLAVLMGERLEPWQTLFLGLLLTLIVVAYDRCRGARAARLEPLRAAAT
jgi:hypothetical protein